MKWNELNPGKQSLVEVPIEDFSVHGADVGGPRLRQMKKPEVRKVLYKAFANVDYGINVYALPKKMIGMKLGAINDLSSNTQQNQSDNPFYYVQIDPNKLKRILPPRIANKIKVNPNETTIIFQVSEEKESFDVSPWSVIHDLVHGLALTTKAGSRSLNAVDKIFGNLFKEIVAKNIHPDLRDEFSADNFMANVLTMSSATSGALQERPEEASTELFTQWLFSGKITLTTDRLEKEYNLDKATIKRAQKMLNQVVPQCEKLFNEILKVAKGIVIITGN